MKSEQRFKLTSLSLIWAWLGLFALLPFLLVFVTSFLEAGTSQLVQFHFTFTNYEALFSSVYAKVFLRSFYVAGMATLFCLILAYPFAFFMATVKTNHYKNLLLLLLMVPFWTSSLIRSYAIIAILKGQGLLNMILMDLGVIHHPLQLLFTNTAVMIGLVYNLLPFMILPLYANIERLDFGLVEAAKDLGASKVTIFWRVLLPMTTPGILSGCLLVFLPAMTIFYIPDLLGGAKSLLIGNLIQMSFLTIHNWPLGSATSIVLTAIMALFLVVYWGRTSRRDRQDLI